MRSFSWSRAFGAGFQLIGREPVAVLWWALAYFVLTLLPQFAIMGAMWPMLGEIMRNAGEGGQPDTEALMSMQGSMGLIQLVSIVSSLVSTTVILSAIYRAVLEPENRRFGYLRLGAQELWVGITVVVLYVALILAVIVITIPGVILGLVLGRSVGEWSVMLVVLACLVLLLWLMLRFSLATVIAFAERRFDIGGSWTLTAGQAWKLFLVMLVLFLLVLVAELILVGIGVAAMGGMAAATGLMEGMTDPARVLSRFWPVILVGAVVTSLLGAAAYAVFVAPFAEVYKELTEEVGAF
jgi:hypothetical protein